MGSILSEATEFLASVGMYDVFLPFLLIYVMVFALVERTRIFGVEKIKVVEENEVEIIEVTKKNLNAMFAFAVSFFALMSSQVIGAIHRAIGPVVLLLIFIVLFILLVSAFNKSEGMHKFSKGQIAAFAVAIATTIALIFLNSIHTDKGDSWLQIGWHYILQNTNHGLVGAIVLIVAVAGFIAWIGYEKPAPEKKKE